jgi:hypothetical protein
MENVTFLWSSFAEETVCLLTLKILWPVVPLLLEHMWKGSCFPDCFLHVPLRTCEGTAWCSLVLAHKGLLMPVPASLPLYVGFCVFSPSEANL